MVTFKAFFSWLKNGLMSIIIPVHMKRLMFLTTLYHYIKKDPVDVDHVDQTALAELNVSLRLAKTGAQSLVLPGLMTRSVWDGTPSSDTLMSCPLEQAVNLLLGSIPDWLIYGSKDEITRDVDEIRQFIKSHAAA